MLLNNIVRKEVMRELYFEMCYKKRLNISFLWPEGSCSEFERMNLSGHKLCKIKKSNKICI